MSVTGKAHNEPPSVLVVDDQETVRFFATQALQHAGFEIHEADNGIRALVEFERTDPDFILLDVMMPEMDGFTVCERIRAHPKGRHVPILMMTGLEDEASITRAYDAGATDFIGKPLNRVVLAQRVRYILRARSTEERVHQLAYFDSLTRLANRESFNERLAQAVALARRHERLLAILFLDLDDFKRVNDTLGHSVGDQLLQAVAECLLDSVRECDTVTRPEGIIHNGDVTARLGGDEFIVLLSETQRKEDAATVADRILDRLSKSFNLSGNEVFITPSIGIAVVPQDAEDAETLLKNASAAMYSAKRGGKNRYAFYDGSMSTAARNRLAMENALRKALDRDEFSLHYQPQMDTITGHACGVEALLRWHNEELGAVSPMEFIPVAEESGLIVPIGDWVLRTACAQARRWRDQGLPMSRMSVNISVLQFVQGGFVNRIAEILSAAGLDARSLELEITESLLAKDMDGAIRTLSALKELGVQLAIDDFGTGYSSLSYLKRLPIDRLKIDRSFVRDIASDPDDAAIATAIAAMARTMGLGVIAEGVETEAQLNFLKEKGCYEIQGYYFSRPLPPGEVARLLTQQTQLAKHGGEDTSEAETVLFLDDDELVIGAIEHMLEGQGYRILTASTPAEAFDALANNRISVVVADYQLPEMSGTEFLTRVSKLCPDAVRIMLSGESDMQSLIAAVNAGGLYKFLEKPIDWDNLCETLRAAFSMHESRKTAAAEPESEAS